MQKTFVLDTNVLLHNSSAIEVFDDNVVVLPMAVIEELDRFKKNQDELGRNARHVIRRLDALRDEGSLGEGVPTEKGGMIRIMTASEAEDGRDLDLDANLPDNRILRIAYSLHCKGEPVIFVSKDINARLKADALGVDAEDFENQKINFDELFTGFREIDVPCDVIDSYYEESGVYVLEGKEFFPNEFVLMRDETNLKHTALARAMGATELTHLSPRTEQAWHVKARSVEQRMALELLMDPRVQLVTLVGPAGTGKTLLAIAAGLEAVLHQKRYEKILVTRPVVPLGRDIGYLPGGKEEKLGHWMQPIFDNLAYLMHGSANGDGLRSARDKVDDLQERDMLELEGITYIRGRSIPRQFVIVDEAQNLTPHEVKTIISRCGEGTKMVLTGDPYQIDNPYLDASSNGLTYTVERLKGEDVHGHVTLRKSERSALAALAAALL